MDLRWSFQQGIQLLWPTLPVFLSSCLTAGRLRACQTAPAAAGRLCVCTVGLCRSCRCSHWTGRSRSPCSGLAGQGPGTASAGGSSGAERSWEEPEKRPERAEEPPGFVCWRQTGGDAAGPDWQWRSLELLGFFQGLWLKQQTGVSLGPLDLKCQACELESELPAGQRDRKLR